MRLLLIILTPLFLLACECSMKGKGIVIDSETAEPLEYVLYGVYSGSDSTFSTHRPYTDSSGLFDFGHKIEDRILCPNTTLYFAKNGYKISRVTFKKGDAFDTIRLHKWPGKIDDLSILTQSDFEKRSDSLLEIIQRGNFDQFTNEFNREVIKIGNTLSMNDYDSKDPRFKRHLEVLTNTRYGEYFKRKYKIILYSRGGGDYIPELNIEGGGTPYPHSYYIIKERWHMP